MSARQIAALLKSNRQDGWTNNNNNRNAHQVHNNNNNVINTTMYPPLACRELFPLAPVASRIIGDYLFLRLYLTIVERK